MIAKVIINSPSSNIDQLFDYLMVQELEFLLARPIGKLWDLLWK